MLVIVSATGAGLGVGDAAGVEADGDALEGLVLAEAEAPAEAFACADGLVPDVLPERLEVHAAPSSTAAATSATSRTARVI